MSKALTLTIEAGLDHAFPFEVERDFVLCYSFTVTDPVYFSVGYEDNKQNKLITWTSQGSGAYLCTKQGKVMFEFDNSKSWLRGAVLTLKVTVEQPLEVGLEQPVCFQLSPVTRFSESTESKIFRIPHPAVSTTRQLLDSGRRLLAFESSVDCKNLTGRTMDFSLPKDATESDLIAKLKGDLHPYLFGKTTNVKPPKVVLGTMTFDETSDTVASEIIKAYANAGDDCDEIDTAIAYGKSEAVLGRVLVPKYPKMIIAGKVNPWPHSGKSFLPHDIRAQVDASFKSLGVKSVNILYLHQPDANTPLEVTLEFMDKLHKEGKFQELGLSNFAAWQVVLVFHICRERGFVLPTVYQGMYNVLTRDVEPELFPALRAHRIRFYAYNPLAGGLLTGRYSSLEENPKHGRYAKSTTIGKRYHDRFWHASYFEAMKVFQQACHDAQIPMAEASFRWLSFHSCLETTKGDAVILGASSVNHIASNLQSARSLQALPQIVLNAANKAWEICKSDCPRYFRK